MPERIDPKTVIAAAVASFTLTDIDHPYFCRRALDKSGYEIVHERDLGPIDENTFTVIKVSKDQLECKREVNLLNCQFHAEAILTALTAAGYTLVPVEPAKAP